MYFDKHASELTLAESAMLAGIPKGPKYYSPYLNMKKPRTGNISILAGDGGRAAHYAGAGGCRLRRSC